MTKTEEIMELVDACVDAAVRDYLSGNGEASYHCDKLKSAIEELVADAARYQQSHIQLLRRHRNDQD